MAEKLASLEKKIEESNKKEETTEFERAKQDVKDEAVKGDQVNVEILHEKLTRLEAIARKINHSSKEKISLLLSRYHIHKTRPSFAAVLVLKSVCSKEEEAMLDKEQKLMKTMNIDLGVTSFSGHTNWSPYMGQMNNPWTWGQGFHFQNTFPAGRGGPRFGPRPAGTRTRMARPPSKSQTCFKCLRIGHYVKDCPMNVQNN